MSEVPSSAGIPPSSIEVYERQLQQRIDEGEKPAVDVNDPNHQLVFCEGLAGTLIPESGYLSFGQHGIPSITCQNTPDGERLHTIRLWQCGDRVENECVCGKRLNRDFFYVFGQPGYEAVEFRSSSGTSGRERPASETLQEDQQVRPVTFGSDWDYYTVDPISLQASNRKPAAGLGLTLLPCRVTSVGTD